MGFNPGFERSTCLATLESSDRTKQSVCGWQYIYRERDRERESKNTGTKIADTWPEF